MYRRVVYGWRMDGHTVYSECHPGGVMIDGGRWWCTDGGVWLGGSVWRGWCIDVDVDGVVHWSEL